MPSFPFEFYILTWHQRTLNIDQIFDKSIQLIVSNLNLYLAGFWYFAKGLKMSILNGNLAEIGVLIKHEHSTITK